MRKFKVLTLALSLAALTTMIMLYQNCQNGFHPNANRTLDSGDQLTITDICDGLDNDDDGQIDEDFDLANDPENCGECNNICSNGQTCETGVCQSVEYCASKLTKIEDSTHDCSSDARIPRTLMSDTFTWKGHSYLASSFDNELYVRNIDLPRSPSFTFRTYMDCDRTGCPFDHIGDQDYVLRDVEVCDDCRYALYKHRSALGIIDLGTGDKPAEAAWAAHDNAKEQLVGMTFKHEGSQYFVGQNKLQLMNGITPADLQTIQTLTHNDYDMDMKDGAYLRDPLLNGNKAYLYLNGKSMRSDGTFARETHIFRVDGSGTNLRITLVGRVTGNVVRQAIDLESRIMITVMISAPGIHIWKISDLSKPALQSSPVPSYAISWAALKYPYAVMGKRNTWEYFGYDLTDPANPVPHEQSFWDQIKSEGIVVCVVGQPSVFSPDGSTLFLAQKAIHQMIAYDRCQ